MDNFAYLLFRRAFIFMDEWLSYYLLYNIYYYNYDLRIFCGVVVLALAFNLNAYISYWDLEKKILPIKNTSEIKNIVEGQVVNSKKDE